MAVSEPPQRRPLPDDDDDGPGRPPAPRSVDLAVSFAITEAVLLFIAAAILIGLSFGNGGGANLGLLLPGAVVAFAVGMAFIYGARQVRARRGRTFLLVVSGAATVFDLYNIVATRNYFSFIFLAIPVVIVIGLLRPETTRWFAASPGKPPARG